MDLLKNDAYYFNTRKLELKENLGNSCCSGNEGIIHLIGNAGDFFGKHNVGCIVVEGNCGDFAADSQGQFFSKYGHGKRYSCKPALFYVSGSVGSFFGQGNAREGICYATDIGPYCGFENKGVIIGRRIADVPNEWIDKLEEKNGTIVALDEIICKRPSKNIIEPLDPKAEGYAKAKEYINKLNALLENFGFTELKINYEAILGAKYARMYRLGWVKKDNNLKKYGEDWFHYVFQQMKIENEVAEKILTKLSNISGALDEEKELRAIEDLLKKLFKNKNNSV